MSSSGVLVKVQPRTTPCHAVTTWHSESALLICSFEYGAGPTRGHPTVADSIGAALGISATPPRALLGDVEVTWEDESRLHSIELRTGRSQWEPSTLPIPSDLAQASSITFELEYDLNRIARIDVAMRVLWDAAQAGIGLRFCNAYPQNVHWISIADSVLVCIDDEHTLVELRFADVQLVSEDVS